MPHYFVRVGVFGAVGCFHAADGAGYLRAARVICRTSRGLEVGEVLAEATAAEAPDGTVLRAVTVEDDLLLARLEKHKDQAYQACLDLLQERQLSAALMEVEHLFDGQSLYFYFLGQPSPEVEALTDELAEAYETQVRFRRFAETLSEGCGPDCGEEAAGGCDSGGCSSCAVAAACGAKPHAS